MQVSGILFPYTADVVFMHDISFLGFPALSMFLDRFIHTSKLEFGSDSHLRDYTFKIIFIPVKRQPR